MYDLITFKNLINIAALFTTARVCKQPKCPSADK